MKIEFDFSGAALNAAERQEVRRAVTSTARAISPALRYVTVMSSEDCGKFAGINTLPGGVRAVLHIAPGWREAPRDFAHMILVHEVLHTLHESRLRAPWDAAMDGYPEEESARLTKVFEDAMEATIETLAFALCELGV